jgi:hypothetical protein
MKTFPRMSVKRWIRVLGSALDKAYSNPQYLKKLSAQHGSIRSWDLGPGGNASSTDGDGWRLLK